MDGESIEARHAATNATLKAHISQCQERARQHDDQADRQREWMQAHELRITGLEGKEKVMEVKFGIIATVAAFLAAVFGPKVSALLGG